MERSKTAHYREWVFAIQLGIVLFFTDQILKTYIAKVFHWMQFKSFSVLPLGLIRYGNEGLFSDLFSGSPMKTFWVYFLPTSIFVLFFLFLLRKAFQGSWLEKTSFALAVSGGFSNLISQYMHGYVLDTFALKVSADRMIPFSIADLGIFFGGSMIIASILSQMASPEKVSTEA